MSCTKERRDYLYNGLKPGWIIRKDIVTGECIYYNVISGEATYDRPKANSTCRNGSTRRNGEIIRLNKPEQKCLGGTCAIGGKTMKRHKRRNKRRT